MTGSDTGSGGRQQQRGKTSRRRLLALSGGTALAALGTAACGPKGSNTSSAPPAGDPSPAGRVSAPPAGGVLAGNVNQALEKIDYAELKSVSGTWIRGFYPMADADAGNPAAQAGLAKLLQAAAHGYGTVLTMKFQYRDRAIPTPGSPAMETALARLDKVLAAVMGKVDILAVGNEPFFETSRADRATPRINEFYEALARHTVRYRQAHGGADCRTRIYMGALTALDRPGTRTAQTRRWMTFAAGNRSIAGVDIHPHVSSAAGAQAYVDYVLPFLRSDQKFLATEFSLVLLWKHHMHDPVDPAFARRHAIAQGTPVWQVVKDAAHSPFGEHEWNDFLLSNPWFAANRGFLREQMGRFRRTGKLAVAGYGIIQATPIPDFGPTSTPWVLNSVFCPYVCKPGPSGLPGRNRVWWQEFRALQHGRHHG